MTCDGGVHGNIETDMGDGAGDIDGVSLMLSMVDTKTMKVNQLDMPCHLVVQSFNSS